MKSYKQYLTEDFEKERNEEQALKAYFYELSDLLEENETTRELVCGIIDLLDSDKGKAFVLQGLRDLCPKVEEVLVAKNLLMTENGVKELLKFYAHIILKEHPKLQFPVWICGRIGELYAGNP